MAGEGIIAKYTCSSYYDANNTRLYGYGDAYNMLRSAVDTWNTKMNCVGHLQTPDLNNSISSQGQLITATKFNYLETASGYISSYINANYSTGCSTYHTSYNGNINSGYLGNYYNGNRNSYNSSMRSYQTGQLNGYNSSNNPSYRDQYVRYYPPKR